MAAGHEMGHRHLQHAAAVASRFGRVDRDRGRRYRGLRRATRRTSGPRAAAATVASNSAEACARSKRCAASGGMTIMPDGSRAHRYWHSGEDPWPARDWGWRERRALSLEREDQQRAAALGVHRQVLHGAHEAQRAVAHARIEARIGDGARPSADARQDGDILHAVLALEGGGLADEAGRALELPEDLAVAGIDGFEPAVHGAVEGDVASRHQRAGPDRKVLADRPRRACARSGSQAMNSPR